MCFVDNVSCLLQKVKNSDVPLKSQHNWTDKHVCFQSYQGLVLCLLIQLSKHVGELIESG